MKSCIFAVLCIVWVPLGIALDSYAFTSYKILFNSKYETTATPLDSCRMCHKKTSWHKRNAYGKDFRAAGHAFERIESRDSDGDGFSNIDEIHLGTFPGDRKSKPSVGAESPETPVRRHPFVQLPRSGR